MEFAITVRDVTKRFRLYDDMVTGPIKEALFFWKKHKYYKEFLAVDNASFQVRRGEVVGIIGPNGAGKTTLLKCIAGLLPTNEGEIRVDGKITALLALGVGIHAEFTGRQNIFYSGILFGMSKDEVLRKTDSIIEFAELGDYIDRPFRTYSTGMKARLLFSISMSIEPDILVVDEALATGDSYFVDKCKNRIRELCTSGATILFVSHNMLQIRELCDRVIVTDKGKIIGDGNPDEQIAAYYRLILDREGKRALAMATHDFPLISGTGEVLMDKFRVLAEDGNESTQFYTGDKMTLELTVSCNLQSGPPVYLFIGIDRHDAQEFIGEIHSQYYISSKSNEVSTKQVYLHPQSQIFVEFSPLLLLNNQYSFWVIIQNQHKQTLCEYRGLAPVFVTREAYSDRRDAVFWQPCEILVEPAAPSS